MQGKWWKTAVRWIHSPVRFCSGSISELSGRIGGSHYWSSIMAQTRSMLSQAIDFHVKGQRERERDRGSTQLTMKVPKLLDYYSSFNIITLLWFACSFFSQLLWSLGHWQIVHGHTQNHPLGLWFREQGAEVLGTDDRRAANSKRQLDEHFRSRIIAARGRRLFARSHVARR